MNVESYQKANEVRMRVNQWSDFRKTITDSIEKNSEKTISYGDKETPIRKTKLDIANELIELLNKRVGQEIATLELEFTKL